jgi:pyrrolidone-carboxylate peptidase
MNGRALFLKTIARETSEVRGGFDPVPAGMTLAQGTRPLPSAQTQAMVRASTFPPVH